MTKSMISTCFKVTKLKVRLLVQILPNRTQSALTLMPAPAFHSLLVKQHLFHLRAAGREGMPAAGSHRNNSGVSPAPSRTRSNTSQNKSTPLAGAPVLSAESSAASTLHAGLRCL